MVNLISNRKLKHKLLAICILPFLVQLFFIGQIIWQDFEVINNMDEDRQLIEIFGTAGQMITLMNIERDISIMKMMKSDLFTEDDFVESRRKTDEQVQKLRDDIRDFPHHTAILNSITEQLNQFLAIREKINGNTVSPKETMELFAKMEEQITSDLGSLAKLLSDHDVSLSVYAFLSVSLEKMTISDERSIVLQGLKSGEIDEKIIQKLLNKAGEQQAYRTIFSVLGSNEDNSLYRNAIHDSSFKESNRIIEKLIQRSNAEIDLEKWWGWQNQRLASFNDVQRSQISYLRDMIQKKKEQSIRELFLIIVSMLIVIPLAIFLLFYSLNIIVQKLKEEIVILAKSGTDIQSSITQATSGTAETAAAVTETTTTVEELKQTAQVAAEKAKNVAEVSKEAINILSTGEKTLEKTIEGMLRIQNGMSTISNSIIKLSEQSLSIGNIIDTVNELAEQSHILAVNAAIEAAKAGEQGKGFSVVAQEVRSLAEQSKQATVQIRNILNDIQNSTSSAVMATEQGTKAVNSGVELSNEISSAMKMLSHGVIKVSDASSQIELSSEQQLVGVNQVNIAMSSIREATEKHLEHMHQIEKSIEGMTTVGTALKDLVSKL